MAPRLWLLLAARAVQGLGAAMMIASTLALVGAAVPKAQTGRAMGLLGTMSAIGTLLGPSMGGALIAGTGWRSIFLVNVPLGLLNLVLVRRHLPADAPRPGRDRGFDGAGTLLLVLTLAAYALAMTLGLGHSGPLRAFLVALAVLGGALFLRWEARAASPLLPVAKFREPALRTGLPMNLLVSTVMMATLVVGPFYLSLALGLQPARVGLVMAVGPLLSTFCGVLAGRAVDRFGAAPATLAGLGLMAAGAAALALLPARTGVAGYLGAILVLTPGYQLFQAANSAAVMLGAPPGPSGASSPACSACRATSGSSPARPSWARCSPSPRRRPTRPRPARKPSPPGTGSPSGWRRSSSSSPPPWPSPAVGVRAAASRRTGTGPGSPLPVRGASWDPARASRPGLRQRPD